MGTLRLPALPQMLPSAVLRCHPGESELCQEKGNPESCMATAPCSGTQRYHCSLRVDVGLFLDPITQPQQRSWLWEGALGPPPELQTSGWRRWSTQMRGSEKPPLYPPRTDLSFQD